MTPALRHLGTALLIMTLAVPIALADDESFAPGISDVEWVADLSEAPFVSSLDLSA